METQQNLDINKSKLNLSFFFLSLGVMITLITSVISALNLFFSTLNTRFPDALNGTFQYGYAGYPSESINPLSNLIIFFPVFLLVSYFWKKIMNRGIGQVDETIKKWMIYIIIFLSSVVMAVDLVVLVRYFVSGEITTRFILKVLAALVVALYVGVYYMFELKGKQKMFGISIPLWASIKSSILVILLIWFSFSVMGSPMKQRALRLDDKRISDLQNIQWQVIYYWQQKEKLPEKITDLADPISSYVIPRDPEPKKGNTYEYNVKDATKLTFELCADFALPMPKGWQEYNYGKGGIVPMRAERDMAVSSYPYGGGVNESLDHQVGRTCFERTIDPDMYPPFENPVKY